MRARTTDLEAYLEALARDARAGDQLPTIRELMQRFGASQLVVQKAFDALKARGLIVSRVGRGTHFVAPDTAAAAGDPPRAKADGVAAAQSVLLLRRSVSVQRGRVLVETLQRRFDAQGHRVLEVSYTDPDHARRVLAGLPRFDACIVQSSFKTIPVELLAALRDKAAVLVVDGLALTGVDVDAVGVEWGEPLARAIQRLWAAGHRRIACAASSLPFLATQLGWRRFESLQREPLGGGLVALAVPYAPGDDCEAALVEALQAHPDCSALVAWGVEDGTRLRQRLEAIGRPVPARLSVVLLGRTDLTNEHADFFAVVGCRVSDQVEVLHQAVQDRWADVDRPHGVRLVPVAEREGQSVASLAPQATAQARARQSPRR